MKLIRDYQLLIDSFSKYQIYQIILISLGFTILYAFKLLLDYLDNKSKYKPFKDSNGNNIIPSKTLNNILCKI